MTASTMRWPLLALIGLLVAIAVGLLATQLVSERIGISAEPISAGESLAPRKPDGDERTRKGHADAPVQTTSTASDHPGSASSDAGAGDSTSRPDGSDGDAKQGSRGSLASPPGTVNPAPAPSGGGSGTITEPEPGDD
jgi:hypothetical protein